MTKKERGRGWKEWKWRIYKMILEPTRKRASGHKKRVRLTPHKQLRKGAKTVKQKWVGGSQRPEKRSRLCGGVEANVMRVASC